MKCEWWANGHVSGPASECVCVYCPGLFRPLFLNECWYPSTKLNITLKTNYFRRKNICACIWVLSCLFPELISIWNLGCCSLQYTRIRNIFSPTLVGCLSTVGCSFFCDEYSICRFRLALWLFVVSFRPDSFDCRCFAHSYNQHFVLIIGSVCARLVYGAPNKFKKYESSFGFRWFVYSPLFAFFSFSPVFVRSRTYCDFFKRTNTVCLPACFACRFSLLLLLRTLSLPVVYWIELNWIYRLYSRFHHIHWWNFWQRTKVQTQKTNHPRLISLRCAVSLCASSIWSSIVFSLYFIKINNSIVAATAAVVALASAAAVTAIQA